MGGPPHGGVLLPLAHAGQLTFYTHRELQWGMTKNPFINAGAAAAYIGAVVLFINFVSHPDTPDSGTLFVPLAMLSLLVLSVLMMAYCFFFTPVQMYLNGQKKEAVRLFSASVATFAGIVVVFLGILLFTF